MTPTRLTTRSKDRELPEPLFTIAGPARLPEAIAGRPPAGALAGYDIVLVNSSAGKDSQAMLDVVARLAAEAGVSGRVVVVHADLGRLEWPGTKDLAAAQAAHYGFRFEAVRNRNWADLLERIVARGRWPDAANRYCTSEFKTGQVLRLMTQLVREHPHRPVRILNCLGMRAQESPARAKKPPFERDRKATNTLRVVDRWLPVHSWSVEQVWRTIRASGVPHHPAYDAGMPRLSCCFCVLASRDALVRSAQLLPELAAEYAAAEAAMGHRFRQDLSMAEVVAEARRRPALTAIADWRA